MLQYDHFAPHQPLSKVLVITSVFEPNDRKFKHWSLCSFFKVQWIGFTKLFRAVDRSHNIVLKPDRISYAQ